MPGKGRLVATLVAFVVGTGALWATILAFGWQPQLGLDLQGGVAITLLPAEGQQVDDDILDQTVTIIRQRVDALGVTEPDIARQGDTIQVQLPGLTDQQEAQEVIGATAQLQFRPVVEFIPFGAPNYDESGASCADVASAVPPPDDEVVLCERTLDPSVAPVEGEAPEDAAVLPPEQWTKYRLGPVAVSGEEVTDATASTDQTGFQWSTNLSLSGEGADDFTEITGQLACNPTGSPQRQLGIVLDGRVESAPPISDTVVCDQGIPGGQAQITMGTGVGAEDEARQLALILRTGALPIQLEFGNSQSVSPTLGRSSLEAALLAGALGLALVGAYLLFLYRGVGLATLVELAMFGLVTYGLIIVMGNTIGFTLTLAGIAGVIISIGIAADSSIIYRERFRDELRAGRTIRTAADHAFDSALRTNLTGNTVSLLAAVILYILAVGPVRGFAFTLGLSTLVDTVLFATFTRSMFGLIARSPRLAGSRLMGLRAGVLETAPATAGTLRTRSKR